METLNIIIATLLAYSLISTLVYIILRENETVLEAFGLGIVGLLLSGIMAVVRKVIFQLKYRIGKRSIIEECNGLRYQCKPQDTDDITGWKDGYKLIKRYASKSEWKDLPAYSKEFIEECKRNCDHCKYNDECNRGKTYVKCEHDEYGVVIEFNKFEKE